MQISQWKKQALDELPYLFSKQEKDREKTETETETTIANLYQQIGQLKVEVDYLKKNQGGSLEIKRGMIESEHLSLSIVRQCELLGIARSSYYYEPIPMSEENLQLMRMLDEQYTRMPCYGTRKMTAWLNQQGYPVR